MSDKNRIKHLAKEGWRTKSSRLTHVDLHATHPLPWLVFLVAIIVQFAAFNPSVNLYDDGIILYGAERVLRGDVPYRDFWTMYGPAQFYLVSALYSIFGTSDLAIRLTGIVFKGAITALSVAAVSKFAPKLIAAAAGMVILLLLIIVRNDGFPVFPALAFTLVSLMLFEFGLRRGPGFLILSGVSTGIATTFRHDLGAYTAVSIGLVYLFSQLLLDERQDYLRVIKRISTQLGAYTAGIMLVLVPVLALLIYAVPLHDLYQNLIAIPAQVYPATRSLPLPTVSATRHSLSTVLQFSVYVPFIVGIWATIIEIRYYRRLRAQGASFQSIVASGWVLVPLLVATSLVFTLKGVVRVSSLHMVQSLAISIMFLAIAATRMDWRSKGERLLLAPWFAAVVVLLGLVIAVGLKGPLKAMPSLPNSMLNRCINPLLPRLHCMGVDNDYLLAARFVMASSNRDDPIYVGTGRHDKIFINAVAFYFMTERRSVTKWHELHPGIQTTALVQRAMVSEMQETPVRFVILDSRWDNVEEPNNSAKSSGVNILDNYLKTNFVEVRRFGSIRIMAKKTQSL